MFDRRNVTVTWSPIIGFYATISGSLDPRDGVNAKEALYLPPSQRSGGTGNQAQDTRSCFFSSLRCSIQHSVGDSIVGFVKTIGIALL